MQLWHDPDMKPDTDKFKQLCLLLLDELRAYDLVFAETFGKLESAPLERALTRARRRTALYRGELSKYQAIETSAQELGLAAEWKELLQEWAARRQQKPPN
jgi:hypothetical protein